MSLTSAATSTPKNATKSATPTPEHALSYEELALWEALTDEVLFQEYLLPPPKTRRLLSEFVWQRDDERLIWWFQYRFVLPPIVVTEAGKAIGKTEAGMRGGCAYDVVNYNNFTTAIGGPAEQHVHRVFDSIVSFLQRHRVISHWFSGDSDNARAVAQKRRRMLRSKNDFSLRALIPSRDGMGFAGEHPDRLRVDETEAIPTVAMVHMDDAVRPFRPVELHSKELFFGVPDGNRTSRFYQMCHDRSGKWQRHVVKIPSYMAPLMGWDEWIGQLQRTGCRFEEVTEYSGTLRERRRIVVTEWSNEALQNIGGGWGEPTKPCFTPRMYDANTCDDGVPGYRIFQIAHQDILAEGGDAAAYTHRLLLSGATRESYGSNLEAVWFGIDPGRDMCRVLVWGKFKKRDKIHPALYWMLQRIDIKGVMDTPTQARIVDAAGDFWLAKWISSDATSLSLYISDYLGDEALFEHKGRYKCVDVSTGKPRNASSVELVARARGWPGQVLLPIDAAGNVPDRYTGVSPGEPVLHNADVATVRILQDLMQITEPKLLLPSIVQDPEFYAEVTSYRENPTGGKRFFPAHPHHVSALKMFAAAYLYADALDVPAAPPEDDEGYPLLKMQLGAWDE